MRNVKQKIIYLWQNAEKILIVLFFLTFSLNIRKVFLTPYSFLNGGFNEYLTPSFSWADLVMITTIIIFTIKTIISQLKKSPIPENIYKHNNKHLSILLFNRSVSYGTIFLLFFLAWSGLSIFWSINLSIAAYRFAVLIEIFLFSFVSLRIMANRKWLVAIIWALVINGLFQSILEIAQFIHNSSLGLDFLGESILGPDMPGVAKIIFSGAKHIRAYGTFPHPNILAGFLIIPMFILFSELIKRCRNISYETFIRNIKTKILVILSVIVSAGFLLTFSRSAFLGFSLGMLTFAFLIHKRGISNLFTHGTLKGSRPYTVLFILITILGILVYILAVHSSFFSNQSLKERNLYSIVSRETILAHPTTGIGIGQFVLNEHQKYPNLEYWQYQPVHNSYLLIFSELGSVGFILVLSFLLLYIVSSLEEDRKSQQLTIVIYYCIIISFLLVCFFDHYFWDLKVGIIIFTLPLLVTKILANKFE